MNIIVKIILAILGVVVISKYIAPLLATLLAPFGVIILILLYLVILAWLLDYYPFRTLQ